jgi:hypothetical protein
MAADYRPKGSLDFEANGATSTAAGEFPFARIAHCIVSCHGPGNCTGAGPAASGGSGDGSGIRYLSHCACTALRAQP